MPPANYVFPTGQTIYSQGGVQFNPAQYNAAANQIIGGYGEAGERAVAGLRGSNSAELQSIYDQYVQARASNRQDLISRGLRNTTRANTDSSSLLGAKWRAEGASNDALARAIAQYQSQFDLAGLGAAGQFLGQGSQLGANYAALLQRESEFQRSLAARGSGGGGGGGGGRANDPFASIDRQKARESAERIAAGRESGANARLEAQLAARRGGEPQYGVQSTRQAGGGGYGDYGNPYGGYSGDYGGTGLPSAPAYPTTPAPTQGYDWFSNLFGGAGDLLSSGYDIFSGALGDLFGGDSGGGDTGGGDTGGGGDAGQGPLQGGNQWQGSEYNLINWNEETGEWEYTG